MDILYKYVTADRALACLPEVGDGSLRATQPSALNDPFECALSFIVVNRNGTAVESDETDEEELDRAYARGLTNINKDSPVAPCEVRKARKKYGSLFGRELTASQLSKRFGIVSLSEDHRNLLMWSHYTTDGSGFVIGYDAQQLQKFVGPNAHLKRVEYGTKLFPVGVSLDDAGVGPIKEPSDLPWYIPLALKSEHWEYEREWRLIVELNHTIGTGKTDHRHQPINIVRVPNEAVVSVHYTERTPHQAVYEVCKRLADPNNRYTAKQPRKLVLDPDSYAYRELYVIPSDCSWDSEWELAGDLVVEIRTSEEAVLAVARHLTVEEYGAGASVEEAVQDLLTSLSEYRESLEEREARLGAPAVADLAKLRGIIRRRG